MNEVSEPRLVLAGEENLLSELKACLDWADWCGMAVAYATYAMSRQLLPDFKSFLKRGGRLRILLDAERLVTDPQTIWEFSTIPGDSECRMFIPYEENSRTLHDKIYLFSRGDTYRCLVGSSNFTRGGIVKNHEANVLLEGENTSRFVNDIVALFRELWNSNCATRPATDHQILETYGHRFKQLDSLRPNQKSESEVTGSWLVEIDQLLKRSVKSPVLTDNSDIAYILGLLAGNSSERDQGVLSIAYVKGLYNANAPDEGFIHAPGVSDTKLKQTDAIRRDVDAVIDRLRDTIRRLGSQDRVSMTKMGGEFSYRIDIEFEEQSKLLSALKPYIDSWDRDQNRLVPSLPSNLRKAGHRDQLLAFLRGYTDIRSRIQMSDRAGTAGRLRIAISVSSRASKFAQDLKELFVNDLGLTEQGVNLLDGSSRGREHILRIDPIQILTHIGSKDFVSISWKQMLLEDFAKYNEEHF